MPNGKQNDKGCWCRTNARKAIMSSRTHNSRWTHFVYFYRPITIRSNNIPVFRGFGVSTRRSTYACNTLFLGNIFFGGFPLFFWAISSRLLPKCDTPVHELLFEFVPNRVIPVNQSTAIASNRFRNLNINRLRSRFPWLICESFNFNKASTKQADMAEIQVVGEHQ